MKKIFLTIFIIVFTISFFQDIAQANKAQTNNYYTGKVINYGIFSLIETNESEQASGSASRVVLVDEPKLTHQTNSIPLREKLNFGYTYVIDGPFKGEVLQVTIKGVHPPMNVPNNTEVQTHYEYSAKIKIGEKDYAIYGFDNNYEMVAGKWTIQIWHDNNLLCEKSFIVGENQ